MCDAAPLRIRCIPITQYVPAVLTARLTPMKKNWILGSCSPLDYLKARFSSSLLPLPVCTADGRPVYGTACYGIGCSCGVCYPVVCTTHRVAHAGRTHRRSLTARSALSLAVCCRLYGSLALSLFYILIAAMCSPLCRALE